MNWKYLKNNFKLMKKFTYDLNKDRKNKLTIMFYAKDINEADDKMERIISGEIDRYDIVGYTTPKPYLSLLKTALAFLLKLDRYLENLNGEGFNYSSNQTICDLGDFYKKIEKYKNLRKLLKNN